MTDMLDTPVERPTLLARARARAARLRGARAPRLAAAPAWSLPASPAVQVCVGHVLGVDDAGRPRVRLDDGLLTEVTAEWALPYRYVPAAGDLLWTIGRGERRWALGVLHGRGRAELAFAGDAAVTAGRRLRLQADRGLRLVGRVVTLRARAVEVVVRALEERLGVATRAVSGLLEEVAGRVLRLTDDEEALTAGSVSVIAEDCVLYNGDVILLS